MPASSRSPPTYLGDRGRALERCDQDGTVVRLNVLRGSPARRLYERHGSTLETENTVDVFMMRTPAHRAA